MSWHKIHDPTTDECQYVASLAGIDLDVWTATELLEDRCPEPHEDVNDDGKIFVPLEWAKADKRARINAMKNILQSGHAPTSFGAIDNDDSSKIKLTGAVSMAMLAAQFGAPFELAWTMADNSTATLTGAQVMQMGQEAGAFVGAVHAAARALKEQLDAIEVADGDIEAAVAAVEAIDITVGWPATP